MGVALGFLIVSMVAMRMEAARFFRFLPVNQAVLSRLCLTSLFGPGGAVCSNV